MAERLALAALMALASFCAGAQALNDPMRPPTFAGAEAAPEEGTPGKPRLQSVLISAERKLAVINGQTVPLGARFGNATLVAVTETSAVLKRGAERETLKLFPDTEKKLPRERKSLRNDKGGNR